MSYRFETTPTRRRNMQAIRSVNNRSTELRIRAYLVRLGVSGWKLHWGLLPGRPDFFFLAERVVVFVDGCFWHCCPRCGHVPKTNTAYWSTKLRRNRARDHAVTVQLRSAGFRVLRFWECDVKQNAKACVGLIIRELNKVAR